MRNLLSIFNFRSIRFKLLGVVVFSFLTFSFFISYNQTSQVLIDTKKALYESVLSFSQLSVNSFGNLYTAYYKSGYHTFLNQTQSILQLNHDVTKVQIIDSQGSILYDSSQINEEDISPPSKILPPVTSSQILEAVNTAQSLFLPNQTGDVESILLPYTDPFGQRPFSILYTINYSRADILSQKTLQSIILTSIFSTLAIIFLTGLVINIIILSPLSKVIQGAKRITAGQLDYLIPVKSKDEVGDLSEAVNFMAAALRKDIEDLKSLDKLKDEFIIIASHNLRTPLTSIRGYLEFLTTDLVKTAKKDRDYLSRATQATNQLSGITEQLINIVNIKSGQNPFNKLPLDVDDLIKKSLDSFDDLLAEKKIKVITSVGTLPQVLADKGSIISVLNNLIDNAIKFSNIDSRIEINAVFDNGKVVISVRDYGKGMSEEQVNGLFQKFHRGTDTLTYDYAGEGLGLYMDSLIIQNHGGQIWATSKPNLGSTFSFSLPIAPQT